MPYARYFPFAPPSQLPAFPHPASSGFWLDSAYGRPPKGIKRAGGEQGPRRFSIGFECSVISESQIGPVSPAEATALLYSYLSSFQKLLLPPSLQT